MSALDLNRIRADFPILAERVRDQRLVYLDNAATTQKPEAVLQAMDHYYRHSNANVHRAVHTLAERATTAYEGARERIARFLGSHHERLIFTRGTTEAINLVAYSWLAPRLQAGDEILVSEMEHHSDIVPWQLVAEPAGAKVVPCPVNDAGELIWDAFIERLGPRTRLVAMGHCSNALGTVNPIERIVETAHRAGVPVLLDGAQAIAHLPIDLDALGVDFYACSAHKAYGPTGFGALAVHGDRIEEMRPWHGGGDMIRTVAFEGSTWNDAPYKFEAGTPDMAGAVGFAAALDYIDQHGLSAIAAHEHQLLEYATEKLKEVPGLRLIGTAADKGGILSFVMDGPHPSDIGAILDQMGIAIRTGHHCAMPLMQRFGIPATARASLAMYNGQDDIDALVQGLNKVHELFA